VHEIAAQLFEAAQDERWRCTGKDPQRWSSLTAEEQDQWIAVARAARNYFAGAGDERTEVLNALMLWARGCADSVEHGGVELGRGPRETASQVWSEVISKLDALARAR